MTRLTLSLDGTSLLLGDQPLAFGVAGGFCRLSKRGGGSPYGGGFGDPPFGLPMLGGSGGVTGADSERIININ